MADDKPYRDRKFCLVLYPEDPSHAAAIEKMNTGGYNFAAILHRKDTWTEEDEKENPAHVAGTEKKPHYHVVLKYVNAVWNSAVAKDLGIALNYIQACRNLDSSLLYLVHHNLPDKFQYDLEDVFGPLKTRLASLLADTDESTRALTIYDLIRNSPGRVTYTEIFEKACKSGLYGDFRRMGSGVMNLINDHNYDYFHFEQMNSGVGKDFESFQEYLRWTRSKKDDIRPL